MMRLLPRSECTRATLDNSLYSYQAVESMRRGMTPRAAAQDAIRRIMAKYPTFSVLRKRFLSMLNTAL